MQNFQRLMIAIFLFLCTNLIFAKKIEYSIKHYIHDNGFYSSGYEINWYDPDKSSILGGTANFVDFSTNSRIALGIDLTKEYCYIQYNRIEVNAQITYQYITNPTSGTLTTGTNSITK